MILSRRTAIGAGLAAAAIPFAAHAERVLAPSPRSKSGAILGEGPLWSERDSTLYWVDIRGKKLNALGIGVTLDGADSWGVKSWDMPDLIDWVVLRKSGGFLVAILRTVHALTLDPFTLTPLFEIEADQTDNRLNDAKVDPKGRLWTGTMHMPFNKKTAALYRIDPDLSLHKMDAPYLCTNGPGFNADGTRMYHNETSDRISYQFDVAADGSLSNKRVFTAFRPDEGMPDGVTTDAQGGIWISHYNGGRVTRFKADGAVDFVIPIPAKQSTSMTFAGPNLDRMFVTTAAQPPVGADDPQAGTLFEVPKALLRGHTGLPTYAFAG
jgi:xylono-1,5-lactonase